MLLSFAARLRDVLVPFLIVGTAILLLLLALLIGQRLWRETAFARRRALAQRYRPMIESALSADSPLALDALAAVPRRHRAVVAELVLAPLHAVRGGHNLRAAELADRLELSTQWRDDLASRRWWRRSEAALALGLLHDRGSVAALTALLDDEHEQVRAAAIDALGVIGDPSAIAALLARMSDPTRYERARLVQALRAFGEAATSALLDHGAVHPGDRVLVATVLAFVGGASARDPLLRWASDEDTEARAAAWRALAAVGIDERAFYHALKGLGDSAPAVRAAAARALARSGRADASSHLADHLDDEWEVAAQAARALSRLGAHGHAALEARVARGPGLGHDLARQILWEGGRY